jgi:hypothetical protein
MATGVGLWASACLSIIIISYLFNFILFNSKNFNFEIMLDVQEYQTSIINLLRRSFTLFVIIDSKFIGLSIFLIANLTTGFINLNTIPSVLTVQNALYYSFLSSLISKLVPFLVYYIYYNKNN